MLATCLSAVEIRSGVRALTSPLAGEVGWPLCGDPGEGSAPAGGPLTRRRPWSMPRVARKGRGGAHSRRAVRAVPANSFPTTLPQWSLRWAA
jgi:hypothetical protein